VEASPEAARVAGASVEASLEAGPVAGASVEAFLEAVEAGSMEAVAAALTEAVAADSMEEVAMAVGAGGDSRLLPDRGSTGVQARPS
jgi:hypothetical protein